MHLLRTLLRAFAIALACAWIMFFAGVFLSIIVMLILSAFSSTRPDMTLSYRIIGLTAAATAFVLGFIGAIVYDLRRLRTTS